MCSYYLSRPENESYFTSFKKKLATLGFSAIDANFINDLKIEQIGKITMLTQSNANCEKAWFICEGAIRSFFLVDGRELTSEFIFSEQFLLPVCFNGLGNSMRIQAIKNSVFISIPINLFVEHGLESLLLKLLMYKYKQSCIQNIILSAPSAEERISLLHKHFPIAFSKCSQRHLSTFIAVSEETYSRNKSKARNS